MGMFDWYRPEPPLSCPACSQELREWQGKDGPCGLFVWHQGSAAPLAQAVNDALKLPPEELAKARLPEQFVIYSYDCPHGPVEAVGNCRDETWSETALR